MNNVACPFCSHPYVDRPNTNSPNVAHNEKVTNKYLEDKAEFDREKAAGTLEEGRKARSQGSISSVPLFSDDFYKDTVSRLAVRSMSMSTMVPRRTTIHNVDSGEAEVATVGSPSPSKKRKLYNFAALCSETSKYISDKEVSTELKKNYIRYSDDEERPLAENHCRQGLDCGEVSFQLLQMSLRLE